MDYETVSADEFGRSLTGIGLNLLSPDVRALAGLPAEVFGLTGSSVERRFRHRRP
jgi:hypothetical protein